MIIYKSYMNGDIDMYKIKMFFLFLLTFIVNNLFAFNIPDYSRFDDPQKAFFQFSLFSPLQPHASVSNKEKGFTLLYNFPGYFSYYGQINMQYSNDSGDSYFLGIGALQIMAGVNKVLYMYEDMPFFANVLIGKKLDGRGYLASLGLSTLIPFSTRKNIELIFDLYFHHGNALFDYLYLELPYTRGILLGIVYTAKITGGLFFHFGSGLSLIQYRYMRDKYVDYEYCYVTWYDEKSSTSLSDGKWDFHFMLPVVISLDYHF